MFNNSKRKKYAAYFISLVLNLPFKEVNDSLVYINNKVDLESVKDSKKCVDFLCKIEDDYIGIEMNNNPSMASLERNISYAAETYKREKTVLGKARYNLKKLSRSILITLSLKIRKR